MKVVHRILGAVSGIAMLAVLLITSFEIGAYSSYGWYEKEYEKYDVFTDLEMENPDVMKVTTEMMAYLRGDRKDLEVPTIVNGKEREFFNDREKAHMEDVQKLFLGGLWVRRGAVLLLLAVIAVIVRTKADWKTLLPKSFLYVLGSFMVITLGAGLLFLSDFNKYFTIFHEIFFDNDLWLLDPRTDLLIRMLPEGFFLDMVVRIGLLFLSMLIALSAISIVFLIRQRKNVRTQQNVL